MHFLQLLLFLTNMQERTVAVFWLYQVKYALGCLGKSKAYKDEPNAPPFPVLLSHAPELLNEKLAEDYYSKGVLKSDEANGYWMLPNLKPLPENPTTPKPISFAGFGNKTKPDPSDFYLERYLRLALVVVQRYLRPDETRRRSWFIQLAFDSIQRQTMQQRSDNPAVPLHSETHAYFYVQLVHAALSQLQTAGKTDMLQSMTYLSFQQLFAIKPSIWKKHYSPKVWDSLQSRGRFNPPDLKPLPTTIPPTSVIESNSIRQASLLTDPNEPFRKLGLIPELPSFDIMYFNHSIFLEDCKSITLPISPSSLPTHAHFLKYVHSFIITAGSADTIPARAKQALALLISRNRSGSYSPTKLTFLLNLALSLHPGISLAYPDLIPPKNEDYFPPPPANSNLWGGSSDRRLHNCPCHSGVDMPSWAESPRDAVVYPDRYPYTVPNSQIYHGCKCHKDVLLDQDKLAAVMAEKYKKLEDQEKVPRGTCWGGGDQNGEKEDGGFQVWVRRNLVLVCEEELGGAWYKERWGGEEGRSKWVRPDRRKGFLVLVKPEEGVDVLGGGGDDAKTLAGGDGDEDEGGEEEKERGDDEDWEAVSQSGTLC